MIRLCVAAVALLVSGATLAPAAVNAAPGGPYYAATPLAAPTQPMLVTRDTVWHWNTNAYTADRGPQRDAIACEMVARSAGKLATFTAGGQPFDADALAKCNARAK